MRSLEPADRVKKSLTRSVRVGKRGAGQRPRNSLDKSIERWGKIRVWSATGEPRKGSRRVGTAGSLAMGQGCFGKRCGSGMPPCDSGKLVTVVADESTGANFLEKNRG